jgi:hypothetical protein
MLFSSAEHCKVHAAAPWALLLCHCDDQARSRRGVGKEVMPPHLKGMPSCNQHVWVRLGRMLGMSPWVMTPTRLQK